MEMLVVEICFARLGSALLRVRHEGANGALVKIDAGERLIEDKGEVTNWRRASV